MISGCNIVNPDESIPAYVEIKTMNVAPNANFGSNSHNIKDVWAYADGKYIGTFELPAKFPVLLEGNQTFQFGAGIYKDGISATRDKYPLYQYDTRSLKLVAGEVTSIDTITVKYFDGITVKLLDDFEGSSFSLDTLNTSLAPLEFDTLNAFEGKKCLKMYVNTNENVLECKTNGPANYFPLGSSIYVEFNYKCDTKFYIGLNSTVSANSKAIILQINPSTNWNKMYFNLSQIILDYGISYGYQLYFLVQLQPGETQNTVYLDNLKWLHD